MQYLFEVLTWWLVIELIGLAALPVTASICTMLPDRGYSVSKIMGLLLLAYFSWVLTYLGLGYGKVSVVISLLMIALISYIILRKYGITVDRYSAIKSELFFIVLFLAFLAIRSYSPDNYWEIGEKFMDMAFINSILRGSAFPPADPWLSGMPVNYYYFGYLLTADLIKLTGTALSVGFNIASAVFFALSGSAVFGIGAALMKKAKSGLIAFVFVLFLGNLVGFVQLLVILFFPAYHEQFDVPRGDLETRLLTFNQWPSTGVIPGSISQVPYHVYLIGDLHPNLISISFQLLILAVACSIINMKKISYIQAITLGLIAGFLYPLNTWDYPAYLAIILIAIFLTTRSIKNSIRLSGLIVISSYILYLPYHQDYKIVSQIGVITSGRTELLSYVLVFGVFIAMISYYLIGSNFNKKDLFNWFVYFVILVILAFILDFQLLILLIPFAVLAYSGMMRTREPGERFVCLLILMGALLGLFAELFYIQDTMSRLVHPRFNTIFKLYIQIWILWGIAASYIFYMNFKKKAAYAAYILIIMASIYPVFITIGQSHGFSTVPTLDGERDTSINYPSEYQAIQWLRNISGTPVVLQAAGLSWTWNSYVSAFTGLPTVLGWEWHEYQWRMDLEDIETRRKDIEAAYSSPDYGAVKKIIDKYEIRFVYIGPVERDRYRITDVFERHTETFKPVFKNQDVTIYEIQ